jgi:hypothetical protein
MAESIQPRNGATQRDPAIAADVPEDKKAQVEAKYLFFSLPYPSASSRISTG